MAEPNLTKSANIQIASREVDFVTRFTKNWQHLRDIIGIMRPIQRAPGTKLTSKYAQVALQISSVGEGEKIPYSEATVMSKEYATLKVEKYAKAVSIEAINDHGYDAAVQLTDDQFLFELQTNVTDRFYAYLQTGTLRSNETTFQMALAMAQGRVRNKWKSMHRSTTSIVGFCNILDAYEYLGAANITVQNELGLNYVKNFLGYGTLFLLSEGELPQGCVIATPVENIALYYVNPGEDDFARADLAYRTDGETNLIGFHVQGNYSTAVSESYALMGMTLFAEYIDGIAVINFGTEFSDVTVTAAPPETDLWGTAVSAIQSGVTVNGNKITGTLKYIDTGTLARDWGNGYFLSLKYADIDSDATAVKVGLVPTQGSGFVELDEDKISVMKISNKDAQRLEVICTNGHYSRTQVFDISGLVLEAPAGA